MSESEEKTLASTIAQEIRAVLEEDASRRKTERDAAARAEEQARSAQDLTNKHVTTIAQLREALGEMDDKVAAMILRLEDEVREYAKLDDRRLATINDLRTQLDAATTKLTELQNTHVPAAGKASQDSEAEKEQHRKLTDLGADALEESDEQLVESREDAAKYKSHYDTRWITYAKFVLGTFIITIILVLYLKSKTILF